MQERPVKVGLLGCGKVLPYHLAALQNMPSRYVVTAVADIVMERATDAAASVPGSNAYGCLEEMLAEESLDLVVLLTPSGLHPKHAKICAVANIACLSEKPFGCSYKEALDAVKLFEQYGVPLFVVLQTRYNPLIQKVKFWHDKGRLGDLYLLQVNLFWHRSQEYYNAAGWRGTRDLDGGAFMNQGSHYIDLLQWFGGEVQSVKSELSTLARKIECEDTGAALVRFTSNTLGVIAVSMLSHSEDYEASLTLLAENATIKIGGKYLDKLEICNANVLAAEMACQDTLPSETRGYGHEAYYERLHQQLRCAYPKKVTDGRESLKSLKLITQIYGSN